LITADIHPFNALTAKVQIRNQHGTPYLSLVSTDRGSFSTYNVAGHFFGGCAVAKNAHTGDLPQWTGVMRRLVSGTSRYAYPWSPKFLGHPIRPSELHLTDQIARTKSTRGCGRRQYPNSEEKPGPSTERAPPGNDRDRCTIPGLPGICPVTGQLGHELVSLPANPVCTTATSFYTKLDVRIVRKKPKA